MSNDKLVVCDIVVVLKNKIGELVVRATHSFILFSTRSAKLSMMQMFHVIETL